MVASAQIEEGTIPECHCICRVKPDCLIVIGYGALTVAPHVVGAAAIVKRHGIFRIKPNRRAEVCYGVICVTIGIIIESAPKEGFSSNLRVQITLIRSTRGYRHTDQQNREANEQPEFAHETSH